MHFFSLFLHPNNTSMKRLLLFFFLLSFLSATAKDKKYIAHYAIRLAEVTCDRDCGFVQKIAEDKFHDMNDVPYVRYRYTDDVMIITWHVSDNAFNYDIINKADSTMTIYISKVFARDWDNHPASFGYSLEMSILPAVWRIPSQTVGSGFLIPLGNYPDKPLLPNSFSTRKKAEREGSKNIGKTYRMLVPVYVGKEVYNYRFTFVVDDIASITEWDGSSDESPDDGSKAIRNGEIQIFSPTIMKEKAPAASVVQSERKPSESFVELLKRASYINYFNSLCPQEKVYLHLDNTAYFQGETIWYAANVVNATTGGEAASKVLYVELLSPTGVVLKQQKLKITDGRCHGSFPLIDTSVEEAVTLRGAVGYPSGYYQIRAYTRAMLNFDDAAIFSRVIPVYKAPEEEGEYANPVMRLYNGKETNRPEPSPNEKPKTLNIQFFPEGGHLISDVACRIAFKATDEHGHGIDIDDLRTEDGLAINISPQHLGMGSFEWLTTTGRERVIVTVGGKEYKTMLPKAEPQGVALHLKQGNDGLTAHIDAVGLTSGTLLGYTLTGLGQLCAFDTLSVNTGNTICSCDLSVPVRRCPTGVYQFTLYNPQGDILAQRLLFIDNGELPVQTLSVTTENASIRPFEEIRLNIQVEGSKSQKDGKPSTFSLAVRDAADYGTAYRDDIRTYLLLSSELKGLIEDPEWYFQESQQVNESTSQQADADRSQPVDSLTRRLVDPRQDALDLLMLVQGWTRYNWRQMAGIEPFTIRHYTEGQLVLDGWAFSRIREKPLSDVNIAVRLTSLDRQHQQETTVTTDSLGYWSVGVEDFEGEWDLYMETRQQGDLKGEKTTRVRLERSSKPDLYAYTPLETWLPAYTWNPDSMLSVQEAKDPEYLLPSDSHLLEEVEVTGRRKYIDFYTFKAFDAEKDAELMIDEGKYTYRVEDYLREKGYDVQVSMGDVGDATDNTNYDIDRLEYFKEMVKAAPINNHRTFWYIHESKVNRTAPSYFAGYALDLEEVKSIIVYDDPWIYETFPGITDLLTKEEIDYIANTNRQGADPFSPGMYVIDIELNPARKRRTYVDKNARSTSFSGYTPVVEFYSPRYPNGPIQGDKDYRRTIYWNPAVTTDADGRATVNFYNNGYSRALAVSAQGLTPDGTPIINE